jgi:hypothetical protein
MTTLWAQEDAEHIHGSTDDEAIQSFLEDQEEDPETVTVCEWAPTEMCPVDAQRLAARTADTAIERLLEDIEDGGEYCWEGNEVDPNTVRSDLYQNLLAALEAIALWYPCSTMHRTGRTTTVNVAEWRKENP